MEYARIAWKLAFRTRRGLITGGAFACFALLVACGTSINLFQYSPLWSSAILLGKYLLTCVIAGAVGSYGTALVLALLAKGRRTGEAPTASGDPKDGML